MFAASSPPKWKNGSLLSVSVITLSNVLPQHSHNADHAVGFLLDAIHAVLITIQGGYGVIGCFQTIHAILQKVLMDFNLAT
jgi:hypothetical protein